MRSFFSFLGMGEEVLDDESLDESVHTDPSPLSGVLSSETEDEEPANNFATTSEQALRKMLSALATFMSIGESNPLPAPSVSVTSVTERPLAIGNWRGTERRGSFAVVAQKGGRLDSEVRFQFWADTPEKVDSAVETLHKRLLTAKDELWAAGFLRLAAKETSLAEHIPTLDAWRKTTNYRSLYEYHYLDSDGAESIIARIPIHSALEKRDSLPQETTVITDEIVRWDDEGAPTLELAASSGSSVRATGLAILAHLPAGWTGGQVTLARLDRSSTALATTYPNLPGFHAAVTNQANPDRHAKVEFASVADFLANFEPAGDPIELGDLDEDGTPDVYHPGNLAFEPPILLETGDDLVQVSYHGSDFNNAVVYLRANQQALSRA